MQLFSNWRVAAKLRLISVIAVLSMIVIAAVMLSLKKTSMMDEKRIATKHIVEAATSIVANYEKIGGRGNDESSPGPASCDSRGAGNPVRTERIPLDQ